MTKFKTGFSKLNIATNGGLSTGGVFGIAGGTHTFKTGLALALMNDITNLNRADVKACAGCVLVLRSEERLETMLQSLARARLGIRDTKFEHHSAGFISGDWFVKTHTRGFVDSPAQIIAAIEEAESVTSRSVRVIVFDHFYYQGRGDNTTYLEDLRLICEERNILAITPMSIGSEGIMFPISAEDFEETPKKSPHPRTENFNGLITITPTGARNEPRRSLGVNIWAKETDTWSTFNLFFKQDPEYGLISDIVPEITVA